ncbi:glycosyltransferase family 4 protein [Musicola paradisiaca]|uniref:Glycosyl transferase group 1 n=1 Tax=Musicola paradisiaca (strain Ech703) TaxID=579405 RepID=C6CAG0_MUSP7|nr:glycosyltransferase family 4 protein [Musicola paradisiaca]ACS86458.1 glycosyl transferase group 1 [Musicola paradisiaca Ech703]
MKIMVISNLYPPYYLGGYELGCKSIVNGLVKRGHDVVVLTSPSHVPEEKISQSDQSSPVILRRLQLKSFQPINSPHENVLKVNHLEAMLTNYANTAMVLDAIQEYKPDCVYLFNLVGIGGLAILDALNSISAPWVLHLMDRAPETLQFGFSKDVLSIFNAQNGNLYKHGKIISMTKHLVDEIELLCKFTFSNKIDLVPGWVDIEKTFFKREYTRSEKLRFVTAGAVQSHKGIDIIVETAALLRKNRVENFNIEIYGDGNIAYYVDLAKQYGVSDLVSFLGPRTQPELIDIYKASDAFLFPTWEREPFGFAPIEAAAVGCIPIITATCGAAERLVGNVHCLKIERSAASLFETLRRFCRHEIDVERIGTNAQVITREDLHFDTCLEQVESILNDVMKSKVIKEPSWMDINRTYLKHNLSVKLFS